MSTKQLDLLRDHLADMDDVTFEHVYECTKRAMCIAAEVEAYTIGFQDGRQGHAPENPYLMAHTRKEYEQGLRAGMIRHAADAGVDISGGG